MRLPVNAHFARLGRGQLSLILVAGLSACNMLGTGSDGPRLASASDPAATTGPAGDYPVIIGAPYSVGDVEYTPSDALNVDQVGFVTLDAGASGYTGAHHTLPLPSYAEVTSLETGRTILVRLERRGPMHSHHVLALSPAALAQLGADAEHPVRVRRVNPPEDHRALLRSGNAAPLRMVTPASLLTVLQRRLPASGAASLRADRAPAPRPDEIETVEIAASEADQELPAITIATMPNELPDAAHTTAAPVERVSEESDVIAPSNDTPHDAAQEVSFETAFGEAPPQDVQLAPPSEAEGRFLVQAAAFANPDNARRAAEALNAQISQSGRFYRVRTGPFATRGEAEASLANVRRAGYSDARILTGG